MATFKWQSIERCTDDFSSLEKKAIKFFHFGLLQQISSVTNTSLRFLHILSSHQDNLHKSTQLNFEHTIAISKKLKLGYKGTMPHSHDFNITFAKLPTALSIFKIYKLEN